jgi:N-acetylglucosamine-6-sulfatase
MPARRIGVPTRSNQSRGRLRGLLLAGCAVLLVGAVASPTGAGPLGAGGGATTTGSTPPNIVLILTDDERADEMARMPNVMSQIVAQGINFPKAFVVNPSCCPSRTTILTGKYSHGTDVYTNKPPHGGFLTFEPEESSTLATWLHGAGYFTGLVGKYLNGYDVTDVPHIPPGWDRWVALTFGDTETGPSGYYNYTLSVDGTAEYHGTGASNYSTTVLGQDATAFVQSAPSNQPLFLYFAPYAPHSPTKVEKKYKTACSDLPPNRPPSFNEADISDKPKYVRRRGLLDSTAIAKIDQHHLADCQSLLSVDDQVGNIVNALQSTGRLSNTLLVFMSDNGYLFGEHRRTGKIVPYEESIHVPMAVRFDPLTAGAAGTTNSDLVLNLDLAPTFADAAGVAAPGAVGASFLPLLTNPGAPWRDHFLIEHWGEGGVPPYCAVRSTNWKYVLYATGEEELYDLSADPYELQNQASNPDPFYQNQLVVMRAQEQDLCQPEPPGGLP